MDVVLKKIHYNSEVFSKIVEDFEAFLTCTKPGAFREASSHLIKAQDRFWDKVLLCQNDLAHSMKEAGRIWEELNMVLSSMTEDELEEGLKALKIEPELFHEYYCQVASSLIEARDMCRDNVALLNEEPGRFWEEVNMLCSSMTVDMLEEGLKALKKEPEIYREDFSQVTTILEGADPEEEFDKWFAPLPCHLYIFYDTVMRILWIRNCQRYTTALGDTGKASLL